jgi:hypothetical protein
MLIKSKDIRLFENLSQYNYGDVYYDFHNNFKCFKILFKTNVLVLVFHKIDSNEYVSIRFHKTVLSYIELEAEDKTSQFIIDTLYRGRFENNGELLEFSEDELGYFYLEFYNGLKLEFWSQSLEIENFH